MVTTCCVFKCTNRASNRSAIAFYRFPKVNVRFNEKLRQLQHKRRESWFQSVNREDLSRSQLSALRICSAHFVNGIPSDLLDVENDDWVPHVNMGYQHPSASKLRFKRERELEELNFDDCGTADALPSQNSKLKRVNGLCEREIKKEELNFDNGGTADALPSQNSKLKLVNGLCEREIKKEELNFDNGGTANALPAPNSKLKRANGKEPEFDDCDTDLQIYSNLVDEIVIDMVETDEMDSDGTGTSTQTDIRGDYIARLENELADSRKEIEDLKRIIKKLSWTKDTYSTMMARY